MKVQLFNPPVAYYAGQSYVMNPSLGLPILASVFNESGHECEVVDLEARGHTPDSLARAFSGQPDDWPDTIGFTALSSSKRGARECIGALRSIGYSGKIVVGGVYATLEPEEALSWGADLVVTGECEGNVVALIENETGIQRGRPAPIESIPAPSWEHHSPSPLRYPGNAPHLDKPEGISMWTRGCPHRCIFCGNEIFKHQPIRYRPPENIAQELRQLAEIGMRSVFVYDDELIGLPMPEGWMNQVVEQIKPIGLTWKAQGRCSKKHITKELMETMYEGGCRSVMWGVESFSQKVLNGIKKGTKVEDVYHTLRTSKAAGIRNFIFTMVGNYGETPEDLEETEKHLRAIYEEGLVDYRQTTVVTPLPHTELWDKAKEEGWLVEPPEDGAHMNQVYADTPWLSGREIQEWIARLSAACPVGIG